MMNKKFGLKEVNWPKLCKTILGVVTGNAVMALSVGAFIEPRGIVMGGATGISLVARDYLKNSFPKLDLPTLVLIVGVILFVLGGIFVGKKFALAALASSLLYPAFLAIIQRVPGITALTNDSLLSALFGGLMWGVGIGLIVRVGASSGGTDILAVILHKWTHVSVAILLYLCDFVVLAFQVRFSNPEQVLYGIVLLVICTLVLNRVMLFGKSQIQLMIISDSYEDIKSCLLEQANVGATLFHIETGFTKNEKKAILCIVSNRKLYYVNDLIQKVDPQAFITISQINEVRGRGFTIARNQLHKSPSSKE